MQPYPIFFPNYPPPPIPTREAIITEGLRASEQSKSDQQWVKSWMEKCRRSPRQISLTDYRQKLIEHAHRLRQYEEALKQSNHSVLLELKNQIEGANEVLYDGDTIKRIRRRKSKRARLRRQKQGQDERIIELPQPPSPSIDEKIQDIQSLLRTIEQLQTIRQQRQKDNPIDENEQLIEIQNSCQSKLLEYSQIDLCNYLFNNHNQSFDQSTNPDGQYLLRAHQNLNNLIQIRQGWDQYCTTNPSSSDLIIPSQWHEPHPPSDSNWSRYIFSSDSAERVG